jgi:hypothetical protein
MNAIDVFAHLQATGEYVGSYLEFYTTMYGLKAGEQFFGLFWGLGLFKLPFAVVAIMTFWEGVTRGGHDGAWFAVRMLGARFAAMYLTMLLFVWPAGNLDLGVLKYDPPPQFDTVNAPEPEQTFGSALSVQNAGQKGFALSTYLSTNSSSFNIRVPIMARLSMMVGHGMNRATTKVLPDQLSMRLLDQGLSSLRIGNPTLKNDLVAFNQQCYIPAVNKFQNFWRESGKPQALIDRQEKWTIQDVGWIGSRILLETEGLYKPCPNPANCGSSLQASTPVSGFPYSTARDGEPMAYTTATTWGRPYCDQWWSNIKQQIFIELDGQNTVAKLNTIYSGAAILWYSTESYSAEEQVVRWALSRSNTDEFFSDDLAYSTGKVKSDNLAKTISKKATEAIAWTGTIVSQPFASAETLVLNNMTQIIQAITLLILYMLLPFVALFSGMNVKVMATYCILIISVLGWQMWWTIVMWVDANLILTMYPASPMSTFGEDLGSKRLLLDRVTNGAATYGPVIWSFLLSFAGYKGMEAFSKLTGEMGQNAKATARRAAEAGVQIAKQVVTKLAAKGLG